MRKIRLLYVDDEQNNLLIFDACFRRKYNVTTCDSPLSALSIVENSELDAVITDMQMPDMTGIEFINQARGINNTIKYFMVTGNGSQAAVQEAVSNGLIDHLFFKPYSNAELHQVIEKNVPTSAFA